MLLRGKAFEEHLRCLKLLALSFTVLWNKKLMVSAMDQRKPLRSEFAVCELSTQQKEKFLDEHNNFRGAVNPPAADMEYMLWDEDLANLAQMWSNQCIWDHGFLYFGDQYPRQVPFKEKIGQNLAREWGRLQTPHDRVRRWFYEHQYYTYSKFASPMGDFCSREPCGHYTQLAWANSKYLGCAQRWCDQEFGAPHPWIRGETIVTCNYGPKTGNIIGEYPYKQGPPCSKCASGSGFCYKNLCRNCDNFDSECGKSLTMEMCSSSRELMAKKCPKMCSLCECPLRCQNGGTVNQPLCVCLCPSGWKGLDCSDKVCPPGYYGENCEIRCEDRVGKETCLWRMRNGHSCETLYMKLDCAASCGYCDDGKGTTTTTTTTSAPPITAAPTTLPTTLPSTSPTTSIPTEPEVIPVPQVIALPNPSPTTSIPTTSTPQVCKADSLPHCAFWAGIGECERNPVWMIPNCCVSCRYHQAPEDCHDGFAGCPVWAYSDKCDYDRRWMQKNCRKSCNQCGDCTDVDPKCPSWALLQQCRSGDRITWMITNCRRSCGLCRVYDKHEECPAWSAMEECKKSNWTWMVNNCPRSCDLSFSEASFCGGKANGNYQAPSTCSAYIACSRGTTNHVACPKGMKYDTLTRMCQPAQKASCTAVCPQRMDTLKTRSGASN